VYVFGYDRSDGMYSVVAAQTVRLQTSHSANDRLKIFGKLVLNDGMKDSVGLQIREVDSCHPMVLFHEIDSNLFVKREPQRRVWSVVGIVAVHNIASSR
jgi:hypothetical protein